jgi:prophage antirepressor-like protein
MAAIIEYTKSQALTEQFPEFTDLTIYGTVEEPMFASQQIQEMLGITKIHYARDYTEGTDYVKFSGVAKDGKAREQNMFTEEGLYNIIARSRTDIGAKLRKFIKVVFRELRLRGQVTLTDALGKLQRELEHQKKELEHQKKYNQVLDAECERLHDKELLHERDLDAVKEQLAQAQTKSGRFKKMCRDLLDEDVRGERDAATADSDALLWNKSKTRYLTQYYFARCDAVDADDVTDPVEDDEALWKITKTRPTADVYSFDVHVWPGVTASEVGGWLIAGKHGVQARTGLSKTTFAGSQQSITDTITRYLLK